MNAPTEEKIPFIADQTKMAQTGAPWCQSTVLQPNLSDVR